MTLVITEISRFGVVMTADTAETISVQGMSGAWYTRIKYGTPKLFPIVPLNGGVSFWGAGEIYVAASKSSRMPTDVWLEDFVAKEKFRNLEEFGYTLCRNMNALHGPEAPALGFQVAGIGRGTPRDGMPVFYRVCNRDKKGGRRPEFEVDRTIDFPHLNDGPILFPDADVALYEELQRRLGVGEPLARNGQPIPHPSLDGRAEYVAAWVRLISDLYQSAGLSRTIGGKVTTLKINNSNICEVKTS